MAKTKKIVVDARPLARKTNGISNYLKMVLPTLCDDDEYSFVFYTDYPVCVTNDVDFKGVKIRQLKLGILTRVLWPLFIIIWLRRDSPCVFWSPRHHLPIWLPEATKSMVTVHDMVWKSHPETMPFFKLVLEKILMPRAINKANVIISVSDTTRKRIVEHFPEHAHKCETILHGGQEPNNRNVESELKDIYISVGTLEPRKNYSTLIQAFDLYASQGGKNNLVIIGKKGWKFNSIFVAHNKSKYKSRIKILTSVCDQQLLDLYQTARGYISTSIDEGYGLPLREAEDAGLQLCISNIGVFQELFSDAALWFNPSSISEIAAALIQFDEVTGRGRRNNSPCLSKYTWSECASLYKVQIQSLINT